MDRQTTLRTAEQYVTKDRQADHGKPEDTFGNIAYLWTAYIGTEITTHDVAMLMILLKIARSQQNPKHEDNYVDLAGYAACAAELAEELYT